MKPSLKYWIFILGMACAIFGVILASVLGSWLNLEPKEQALLVELADKVLPFPLMGALVLFLIIGGMVSLLFRYYIIPILQMAESTQLISLANPHHRLPTTGASEVVQLASIINHSADAYQKLQQEVDVAIREAKAELLEERNRFAALMSELPVGVLVCTTNGQILLYNKQAQQLLQAPDHEKFSGVAKQGGWIGLGRSLFGVVPRDPVAKGLEQLQRAVAEGEAAPVERFLVTPAKGEYLLHISMAPVFSFHCEQHEECFQCECRRISGLVLTLDNSSTLNGGVTGMETVERPTDSRSFGGDDAKLPGAAFGQRGGLEQGRGARPVFYEFNLFHHPTAEQLGGQPLRQLTYVVFDTETTGLDPAKGDEIIQLGAVRIVNGRIIAGEMIDQLIDPKRPVPEASSAIHGITGKMVAGQPTIGQVLPHFHRFAENSVLVAHNAAFDMRCLELKEEQTGVIFNNPVLDTLLLSTIIHPHQESHSLDEIAARLNLTNIGHHTALGDAIVTAEVLLKLIPLLESKGIVTLDDALQASANSPYAKINY